MRIADESGNPLSSVYLALSDEEAKELGGDLKVLLTAEPGWHAHIADHEGREITVYRSDDETAAF